MSTNTEILTIRADTQTQKNFKNAWRDFNKNRLGTVTQAEYLQYLLDNQTNQDNHLDEEER